MTCRVTDFIIFLDLGLGRKFTTDVSVLIDGFGGLVVSMLLLVPEFAGSNPAEAVGFFGRKNPQHAFLRRGSK